MHSTISRRQFLVAATAGATLAAHSRPGAQEPARYDLVIEGGRLVDPGRLDGVRDMAIRDGRIVSLTPDFRAAEGAPVLDAKGKLVVPGLIDIHTHAGRSPDGPPLLLKDGVTGWIDGGSQGADGIDGPVAVARSSPQLGRVLINIGRGGIRDDGDTLDLARADIGAARAAIQKHRDIIVGIKARLSAENAGANDYNVLRRAQTLASEAGLPVMIHMGQSASPLPRLLDVLKPGDIVTHMFAPPPNAIVDEQGRILPAVLAARKRGVIFDVGNGRVGHIRWDMVKTIMAQGFWPDTISSDWNTMSRTTGVIDLANCLSKFLMFGMSVSQVIAAATVNASRVFPVFRDRGTLKLGAIADIAILELREGAFEFEDNYGNKIPGRQRLFPSATILNGVRAATAG